VNLVLDELATTVLVNVNAACLTVMDLTLDYHRVGVSLHFEAGNAIVVNVVGLKVTLQHKQPYILMANIKKWLKFNPTLFIEPAQYNANIPCRSRK
jgi:hypothetical protein